MPVPTTSDFSAHNHVKKHSRNNNQQLKNPNKQPKQKTQPKTQTPQSLGSFYPTTTKERKKLIENLFFAFLWIIFLFFRPKHR
jgi:hypothetical protein